jgi:DNA repair ATPase RecN
MPKGKPWTADEEKLLKQLTDAGEPLHVIAARFNKSQEAIVNKARRLGLEVVVGARGADPTTTEINLPKELPSVEEALKILAATLQKAAEPGLSKVEVQRLQAIATIARTYKELIADYINYREIEKEYIEMREKYENLLQTLKERTQETSPTGDNIGKTQS